MAIPTSCCFNLSPPPPNSNIPSLPLKSAHVAWPRNGRSRTSQCVLGVACMIIGLEMGNLVGIEERAIAGDMNVVLESQDKVQRWSDKRTCVPWRVNSLETIVPENLPRPSARRRWEAVGSSKVAPTVEATTTASTKCFTM
ncbi:unnamed protein product [Ilex paraguariensis]|uniref:Uncharacterized protein n=1 Tax=Ilex paraguariensis TaxID=185542 RepID=A0ABC8SEG6_9AQUA